MKYDDQFFNLSTEAYTKVELSANCENEEILKKQSQLLKILLKRFQAELKSKKLNNSGILKVKFQNSFSQESDLGYNEIDELVKSNNFDAFASQYCFYLKDVEYNCDESLPAYYEIIWDYKTYFEQLSMQQINITNQSNISNNEFIKAINDFQQLPIKYQIDILKSFVQSVEKGKNSNEHDIAVNTCLKEGHLFDEWKTRSWPTKEVYWDAGPQEYIDIHKTWWRTCMRCGYKDVFNHEPQELIDARKAKYRKSRIKKLESELKKLKNE